MLPNIKTIFKKYLPVLHSNQEMLRIFPENTKNVTHKKKKKLKRTHISIFVSKSNKRK